MTTYKVVNYNNQTMYKAESEQAAKDFAKNYAASSGRPMYVVPVKS